MKKLLTIMFALLLLCAPALAEESAELHDLAESLLPGDTCVEAYGDDETLVLLMDKPDGTRVFVGGVWEDGAWQLTVSTPLPAGTEMDVEDEYDGYVILGFYHPTADELPWAEHYVELVDGTWQVTLSQKNRGELICYEDGCITSDMYDDYYGAFTLPLDVASADWLQLPLTFADAMAHMDTAGCEELNAGWSAFEEDSGHVPNAEAAAFCAEHLLDYAIYDGRAFEDTALLLADDTQGVRYFFGCVKVDGEWCITRSTPLPEGATCETFHAGWNWLRIWLPLPRERQNVRAGADSIRCTVTLTGGRYWEVAIVNPTDGGVMSFEPHAICEDTGHVYYGDYDLPLDVTVIDWLALPANYTEALDLLDSTGWAQVKRGGAALRTEADEASAPLGTYTTGAPMRVHQQVGGWAQVSPIGSDLTGWMPLSNLLPGEEQAVWNEEYRYWSSRYTVPQIGLDAGELTVRHTAHAPGPEYVYPFTESAWVDFLGLCADGCCCHVYYGPYGLSGYIPVDALPPSAQMEVMAFRDLPEYSLYSGSCSETAFAYLMEDQNHPAEEGGSLLLYCGAKTAVGWRRTISAPLPAGVWASFFRRDMEAGTFALRLNMDGAEDICYTFARQWDNTWAFTGVWGVSRDTAADSYTLDGHALYDADGVRRAEAIALNVGLASLDWLTLPRTFDEALSLALPVPEGCTLTEGRQFPDTAMYLMDRPDGTTVFAGFDRTAEGWRLTVSTPLPEGDCWLDAYHADVDCITINYAMSSTAVALQEDGRWHVTWANDVSISDDGLWFGMIGPYYADVLIDRDMTRIDWAALPTDYEGWLALTDASSWAVVTGEGADLRAEDGSVIAAYPSATPVRLLEHRGGLYRVAVEDGSVTGWMDESALLVGTAQLTIDEEGYLAVVEDDLMWRGE